MSALLFFAILAFFCGQSSLAADKSGVTPNTISLPKGPGSIEGLGEAFQPTLNTGTAKYSIGLRVPPGPAGHQPELRLVYEGGSGNGPLGYGWQLPAALVQRQTDKGIPTYGEDVGFPRSDRFINEQKEELVPGPDGFLRCKNEGAFIRYRFISLSHLMGEGWGEGYWQGTLPDGTRLEFGPTETGRIQESTNRIFAWLLERETDTRGNTILYAYTNFAGAENTNRVYLSEIRYGPGAPPWANFHFVRFHYEDRPDWFEDCRSGFVVRTGKRLRSIVVGTQGPTLPGHAQGDFNGDGLPDHLVRRYELEYLAYAGTNSHWSLLAKVTVVGADGTNALPPTTFAYSVCNPPDQISAAGHEIGGENEPPWVMDLNFVDLVDLNGDGLPDLLQTGGPHHVGYMNCGQASSPNGAVIRWSPPVEVASDSGDAWNFNLSAPSAHLADMDGDGLADLVNKAGFDLVFYFRNRGRSA